MSSLSLGPADSAYETPLTYSLRALRVSQPQVPKDLNLAGQCGIITGGNTGIGFEAAQQLLSYNLSCLIITVRDAKKGEHAISKLKLLHQSARIEAWPLDMLSYDSIQAFSKRCSTLDRIDFAILNAGTKSGEFKTVEGTGHEIVFQVNYLSTALLAVHILPVLKEKKPKDKPSRLTFVGSGLALSAKFPERTAEKLIPAFDKPITWGVPVAQERYATTKLLLLMFLVKLAESIDQRDVVVNVADPGFVNNGGLDRTLALPARAVFGVMRSLLGRSIKAAASTYVDAAVIKADETHGSWMVNWTVFPFPAVMHSDEGRTLADRLWEETMVELKSADVQSILAGMKDIRA